MRRIDIDPGIHVYDDDATSENQAKYRETIMAALENMRDSDEFDAADRRRADKMLFDCYRLDGADYDEHGDSSDNKHLEF